MLKGLKAWLDGLLSWLRSPPSLPAENRDRSAVCYEVTYLPTGDEFRVVSIHSPSSDDWDTLTQHKKETIFRNCVQQARGRSKSAGSLGATPSMWILCEDLNTDAESLLSWKREFENDRDPEEFHIQNHYALTFVRGQILSI